MGLPAACQCLLVHGPARCIQQACQLGPLESVRVLASHWAQVNQIPGGVPLTGRLLPPRVWYRCDTTREDYSVWDGDGSYDTYDVSIGVALDPTTKQCVPCALPGCSRCADGANTCSLCLWWLGWTMTEQGCVKW